MKISREARQEARRLYRSCLSDGRLATDRLLQIVQDLLQRRPRGYLAIAERIKALVRLEVNRQTHIVRSAVELPDRGQNIFDVLEEAFGPPLAREYYVSPDLIGGLSIQVGSNIWDGSVQRKLRMLSTSTLN